MDSCMKPETSPEKPVFECDKQDNKCVKRRRRSSSLLALSYNEQPQPLIFPLDQAAPNTTKRSSRFRGVSRHRWTRRYEAHLWDKGSWNATQKKKGKQVYLGAYDEEEAAARAYDLAAIKYWGSSTYTNFPISDYDKEMELMQNVTREEYLASLRRRSSGFARGVSKYRGVARHHHNGRWEARIGRVFGNKYLYLGTYGTQEEAAQAYDIAAIEYRGVNAVTNFDLNTYIKWLRPQPHNSPLPKPENPILQPKSNNYMNLIMNEPSFSTSYAIKNPAISDKRKIIERKMPLSPFNKATTPSALGLLLRSSMFKQLVEKSTNSNAGVDKEKREDDTFMFYAPNDGGTDARDAKCERISPLYDGMGKIVWNNE